MPFLHGVCSFDSLVPGPKYSEQVVQQTNTLRTVQVAQGLESASTVMMHPTSDILRRPTQPATECWEPGRGPTSQHHSLDPKHRNTGPRHCPNPGTGQELLKESRTSTSNHQAANVRPNPPTLDPEALNPRARQPANPQAPAGLPEGSLNKGLMLFFDARWTDGVHP